MLTVGTKITLLPHAWRSKREIISALVQPGGEAYANGYRYWVAGTVFKQSEVAAL